MNKEPLVNPKRFDVWLVSLDPTIGREIKKTRPCLISSPNELAALSTVVAAPMSSRGFELPVRVKCRFQSKEGLILLDQLRAVDKRRLLKKLGVIDKRTARKVADLLVEMFAYD